MRPRSGNQRQHTGVYYASGGQICLTGTNTVKNRVCLNRSSDTAGRVCAMRAVDATGQLDATRRVKSFNYARQSLRCARFVRPENGDAARPGRARLGGSPRKLGHRFRGLRKCLVRTASLPDHNHAFRIAAAGRGRTHVARGILCVEATTAYSRELGSAKHRGAS
jgi:hypothetical protein